MKVAALQMTSGMDVAENLSTAARLLESVAARGSRLAVLPENFAFMGRQDADKRALAEAGCFAIVLEAVPDGVARMVTDAVDVPTIGIGAGRHCDGQVLVYADLLGFEDRITPRFVRRYAELKRDATEAVARFCDDVRAGTFPSSEETYHMTDQMPAALHLYAGDEIELTESAPAEAPANQ